MGSEVDPLSRDQGARLRQALEASNLSRNELADRMGVTRQTVYSWLKGGSIGSEKLARLAGVLGLDIDWLVLGRSPKPARDTCLPPQTPVIGSIDRGIQCSPDEAERVVPLAVGDPEAYALQVVPRHAPFCEIGDAVVLSPAAPADRPVDMVLRTAEGTLRFGQGEIFNQYLEFRPFPDGDSEFVTLGDGVIAHPVVARVPRAFIRDRCRKADDPVGS